MSRSECPHGVFNRVGGMNGVYQCADCDRQIIIPEFQWVGQHE